jgi:hypothetical protein
MARDVVIQQSCWVIAGSIGAEVYPIIKLALESKVKVTYTSSDGTHTATAVTRVK